MTMPVWLSIANGPAARFTLALLLLGLIRLVFLTSLDIVHALKNSGGQPVSFTHPLRATIRWLLPVRLWSVRPAYSYASYVFHIGILIVSLFQVNHLDILKNITGFTWTPMSKFILDGLTLATVLAGLYLLFSRIYTINLRLTSKPMDYLLLLVLLLIYSTGFIAGQPWNPIPYDGLMLLHTCLGLLLLVAIPFTKISHCILYPFIRLNSEIGWRFKPHAGGDVVQAVYGPGGRNI